MPGQVVVSYSHRDAGFVRELTEELEERGIPVWIDKESLDVGSPWSEAIQSAIRECACLLLVLSPDSMSSDEVTKEWRLALECGRPVLPLLHGPCDPPGELRSLHFLDFTSPPEARSSLEKLVDSFDRFSFQLETPVLESSDRSLLPQLSWSEISGAERYEVQYSGDPGFANAESRTSGMTLMNAPGLIDQRLFYRVKAVGRAPVRDSEWSNMVERAGIDDELEDIRRSRSE